MFYCEQEPLSLLIELTPKSAKKRYRQSIYEAWNHKCAYCKADATSLDHIIPRFKSGSNNRNNLVPACRSCNANKASTKMEDWYCQQEFFDQIQFEKIQSWMSYEIIDIFYYGDSELQSEFAV
jgi:hypothetical protein